MEGEEEGGEEEDVQPIGRLGGASGSLSPLSLSLSLFFAPPRPPLPPQRRASLRLVMRKTPPACLASGR